ncbi:hypothetical protein O3S80_50875 [Streptomyces sp. Lzd4kr]|nr:hypothetical protein [Streptomyces sp. Lzd4kr]
MTELPVEDLQKIRDHLREEIREARGTLKHLRYETKAARDLADTTRRLVAELAETQVQEVLEAEVKKELAELAVQTREHMGKATTKVMAEFDKLRDLLLGTDRADGEPSIPDLLKDPAILGRARQAARRNTGAGRG